MPEQQGYDFMGYGRGAIGGGPGSSWPQGWGSPPAGWGQPYGGFGYQAGPSQGGMQAPGGMPPWLQAAMMGAGLAVSGAGSYFGARSADRAQAANLAEAQRRYNQMLALIMPRLGVEPGSAETMLEGMLQEGAFTGGGTEGNNVGQDFLMQMLRSDPVSADALFEAWEPLETRALDQSLSEAFGQATGLGQRFGSSMMREEGRVRGEHAENAAARRTGTATQLAESHRGRQQEAATTLSQQQQQEMAQFLAAIQTLSGMQTGRQGMDVNLLGLLTGQPQFMQQGSAVPGAFGDMGQMLAFLPLLMGMMRE